MAGHKWVVTTVIQCELVCKDFENIYIEQTFWTFYELQATLEKSGLRGSKGTTWNSINGRRMNNYVYDYVYNLTSTCFCTWCVIKVWDTDDITKNAYKLQLIT